MNSRTRRPRSLAVPKFGPISLVVAVWQFASLGCSGPASERDKSPGSNQANGGTNAGGTNASGGSFAAGSSTATGGTSTQASGGSNSAGGSGNTAGGSDSAGGSDASGGTPGTGGTYGGTGQGGTGAGELTGEPGVWENVTPDGVNLSSDFGAQDVLADPSNPGIFYGFVCLQGVYKSTDWGLSWAHVSTGNLLEQGRPWGEAMAPDGSYMLASSGYPANGNQGAWKSTDDGVTWTPHTISNDNDPYNFDIDKTDKDHVLTAMHASDHIYESTDGGESWTDKGSSGAGGSNYVFFITSTTWIAISQDGSGNGTRRTTNSGSSWAEVGPMEHAHGNAQIFIDPDNAHVYAAGHNNGVYRSTDGAASFTQISNTRGSTVFATSNNLYSMDPGANGGGTEPVPQSATREAPTSWSSFSVPSGMTNGAKRAATMYDEETGHWVIVTGNWNGGFWRYVEE
jgi:hypothetical protein